MNTRTIARASREDGSLLLALLAVLIIGGLVTVLLASTVTGQRQVQFDRNFSNAVHPADSGIEAAITYINTEEASDTSRPAAGDSPFEGEGEVADGYRFEWEAKKVNDQRWEIFAYGEAPDGTVRLLEAEVTPEPLFRFAAFAKTQVGLGGGNTADSYDPDSEDDGRNNRGDAIGHDPGTGRGIIGSNGVISIGNNSTAQNVDGAELHNFTDDDTLDGRVVGTCASCDDFRTLVENGGKLFGVFEDPLLFDTWWISRTLAEFEDRNPSSPFNDPASDVYDETNINRGCNQYLADTTPASSTTPRAYQGSAVPDQLEFRPDEIRAVQGGTTYTWEADDGVPGGVWCAGGGGIRFTGPTNGEIDLMGADGFNEPDPAVFYTNGDVRIDSQLEINCDEPRYRCSDKHPFSLNFQIYTTGTEMFINNQTQIAALLYAPNASCAAPTSNASAEIFGSVVCDNMSNVGGWKFHFDENSRTIQKQEFQLETWREEPGGTTFDWVTISPR